MKEEKKLGVFPLTMLVIGSLIGGGIFNLMKDMSESAALVPMLLAWLITAVGMGSLALCFQNLNDKRPDLSSGIFSYAREGFGDYMGFNSAWGYWLSAWLGNVAYGALLFSALSYFFKIFGNGNNVWFIIGASVALWLVHALILKGVETAAFINTIVTIAKLIPLLIFLLATFLAVKFDLFTLDIFGTGAGFEWQSVFEQVNATMGTAVWVFIGIEGAVVFSDRARNHRDIGRATMYGLLTMIAIYVLISVLSLGVMSRAELAALDTPAMGYVLEHLVGKWGAVLINIGVIIAVSGAWLAWTMFATELPYGAAKAGAFPKFFAKENANGAPVNALLLTNGCIQLFLLTFLFTEDAYNFSFSLASSAILIPYAFTALYQLKYSLAESAETPHRSWNILIGWVSTLYAAYLIYATGFGEFLLTMLAYVPGMFVYQRVRKEQNRPVFVGNEGFAAMVIWVLFFVCIYLILTGKISVF